MQSGHRWEQTKTCSFCSKASLAVFVWNKKLSELKQNGQGNHPGFKHSHIEPVNLTSLLYRHPILFVDNKAIKMLPLVEYMERLNKVGQVSVRNCNNEIENHRHEAL
jgi:hypothetical protein